MSGYEEHRPQKRLFLLLLLASLAAAGSLLYGIWRISFAGLAEMGDGLPILFGLLLGILFLFIGAGVIGIILIILGFPTLTIFQKSAWSAVNILFPVVLIIGRLFDVNKEKIERSFIAVSNHIVKMRARSVQPQELLILLPHCLQFDECPYKITRDIRNCRHCGRCQIGDLIALADANGCMIMAATGGTLARKMIRELHPKAVLAVACERDLTTGIQDIFPLPVIGVLNERPFGPCCNTRVNLDKVQAVLDNFLNKN